MLNDTIFLNEPAGLRHSKFGAPCQLRVSRDFTFSHSLGQNPDFLLGGRTSASAKCRHWSGRAVRWSSCAILLRATDGASLLFHCARAIKYARSRISASEIGCVTSAIEASYPGRVLLLYSRRALTR
jgi:hypothetical protein